MIIIFYNHFQNMDKINNQCLLYIYDYIPQDKKKYVNKKEYETFLNIIYPNKKEDWFPVEVYGKDFTGCLNNMFQFIIKNNLQKWFSKFEPDSDKGFMFSSDTVIDQISQGVEKDGHSGATFCYSLRIMQDIFKNNNFSKWIKHYKQRELDLNLPHPPI